MVIDSRIHGVVFDWDGTLVDSQTKYLWAWRETLREYAYDMTAVDERSLIGRAFPDAFEFMAYRAGLGSRSSFELVWRRKFDRLLSGAIRSFPDAVGCLKYVNGMQVRLAVATQTPRVQFDKALASTYLGDFVTVAVCRDEVNAPKPAPDIYLEACRRIDRSPANCLAIEDSPVGAASARAAGLWVLGVARDPASVQSLAAMAHDVVEVLTPNDIEKMFAGSTVSRS